MTQPTIERSFAQVGVDQHGVAGAVPPAQPLRLPQRDDAPTRQTKALNAEEYAALAHLRGWAHYSPICPVCMAFERGREAGYDKAIRQVACGE